MVNLLPYWRNADYNKRQLVIYLQLLMRFLGKSNFPIFKYSHWLWITEADSLCQRKHLKVLIGGTHLHLKLIPF